MRNQAFRTLGHNFMESPEILPTDSREDIVNKCGFNFSLVDERAGYVTPSGAFVPMPRRKVLRRSDTGAPVSIVSDGFTAHQPSQIIDFFFDYAEKFKMKLTAAGVINGGQRYWALAKTGVEADLNGGGDTASLYALLATGCDGSLATISVPTAVRPACSNSWRVLYAKAVERGLAGKQLHRAAFSEQQAAEALGFDIDTHAMNFEEQVATIRRLNDVQVDDVTARQWFRDLLRPKVERDAAVEFAALMSRNAGLDHQHKAQIASEPRGLEALLTSYSNAPGARPGTARGLWEASTYYIDHVRGKDDDARVKSALFGQGNEIKERAWTNVTALLN